MTYLIENDQLPDGDRIEHFTGMKWDDYLNEMSRDGTYGDEITLRAVSEIYNVEINIVSTLGHGGFRRISPQNSEPMHQITLGHFAEGQGFHYIVLNGNNNNQPLESELEREQDVLENLSTCSSNHDIANDQSKDLLNNDDDNHNYQQLESENGDGSNSTNNNNLVNESENVNYLDILPEEVLEKIFRYAMVQSDNTFPNHVCWTYNNVRGAIARLPEFAIRNAVGFLPRLYINNDKFLPATDSSGEHHVNVKRLRQAYGTHSGLIRDVKAIVNCSKWHFAWLVLIAEAHGWFIIRNIYWKNKH